LVTDGFAALIDPKLVSKQPEYQDYWYFVA